MAKVLSSISGNLISAASAGYAPTNSGDVSAIASSYQVVSATGTQLYAGTAHVTSINSAPISASRAGNAANASMATSAYYDGTGRLISALPDSAAVSSIASSYATAKQDASAMTAYAKSADVSGTVNTVVNNSANWNGVYTTVYNNSASWSGGATGDYVEKSATAVGIGSAITATDVSFAQGITCSASTNSLAQGTQVYAHWASIAVGQKNTASWAAAALGYNNQATNSGVAIGSENRGNNGWTIGKYNTAKTTSVAIGAWNDASGDSVAIGGSNKAKKWSVAFGIQNSAINSSTVIGQFNLCGDGDTGTGNSAAFVIGDGTATAARHDLMVVTKDGEITMYSSTADTVGTGIMSSIRAISAAATGGGGVDSATVSAIASSYAESAVSSKADSSALSSYALSSDVSGCIDAVSSNSASWATVTGKLDSSASSSFYTTANESGYIGSAYVESSISAYQPVSGMSAYESSFSAGVGLEFVQSGDDRILQVDTPVDIVAGPGIVIDNPDGNTLRVSTEADAETVLSNTTYLMADNPTIILSEPAWNFEYVDIYALPHSTNFIPIVLRFKTGGLVSGNHGSITVQAHAGGGGIRLNNGLLSITASGNLLISETKQFSIIGTTVSQGNAASSFVKVIGIHRIAGGN